MEQAFSRLDIPTAGIRAGWFMENFAGLIPGAIQSGKLMSFLHPTDLRVSMVAVNDIGKLAAELLNQHWVRHRIIELEWPCQYSADDVASRLSYYTTRPITAVPIPGSEYEQTYTSFGFTADASIGSRHLPPITYSVSDSEIHAWYIVWFADSKPAGHPTKK